MKNIIMKNKLRNSNNQLSGKDMRNFSVKRIAAKIMDIMKNHIGSENSISKIDFFKKLYKVDYDENRVDHWMLWEFTKRAMHRLRSKSNCFVCSLRMNTTFEYFVVADDDDAEYYINQLDESIKRMRNMQRKVLKSVEEKWHTQQWELDYKPVKQINKRRKIK